jgi:hypothetical protein
MMRHKRRVLRTNDFAAAPLADLRMAFDVTIAPDVAFALRIEGLGMLEFQGSK